MNLRCLLGRHRWALHSHAMTEIRIGLSTPLFQVSGTMQCIGCGKRRYVEHGRYENFILMHRSREECMVWLRAQCDDVVPDSLPESIGKESPQ